MDKTPSTLCPYLGSWRDPATAYSYPTDANACLGGDKALDVDKEHQAEFCLAGYFSTCPLFQSRPANDHKSP